MSVYFWREDDAGYVFDSEVIDEVFAKGISSLKISHSDSLYRTQKRKSIRIKMHKPAYLYLMGPNEESAKIETIPGAKCFMEDLSDTGCAVIVGGQAAAGMRIKIQFALNGAPICMSGTVRSVDFKEAAQRSLLHVEADPLPLYARNKILGEVFGMQSDNEDDLPYRITNEDTPEVTALNSMPSGSSAPGSAATASSTDATAVPSGSPASPATATATAPAAPSPVFDTGDAAVAKPPSLDLEELTVGSEEILQAGRNDEPPLIPFPPEGDIL
jgi:hypothetical protein